MLAAADISGLYLFSSCLFLVPYSSEYMDDWWDDAEGVGEASPFCCESEEDYFDKTFDEFPEDCFE